METSLVMVLPKKPRVRVLQAMPLVKALLKMPVVTASLKMSMTVVWRVVWGVFLFFLPRCFYLSRVF